MSLENQSSIEVINLVKDYGEGRGVFDVSFKINSGECFGFLGPNGAGKSTTIRHILGFCKPDSGRCLINGKDPIKYHDEIFEKVGYLPGEISLPNSFTGKEFLKMQSDLKKIKNKEYLEKLIKRFDVDINLNCKEMSLGMKRRLAIVNCFMNDPDILILDEPTSGLDLSMQQEFIKLIVEEREKNKTILFSSHIFSEIKDTSNRIAIIKDGKIVSEFSKEEYNEKSSVKYFIKFKNLTSFNSFTKRFNFGEIEKSDKESLSMDVKLTHDLTEKFLKLITPNKVIYIKEIKKTLEEKFLSYYKEDKSYQGV